MSITHLRFSRRYRTAGASLAATLALGGLVAGCGSSPTTATTTTSTTAATAATATPAASSSGAAQPTPPGFGKDVTGAAANKVKAAALAKYPGTAERVVQLDDGSYVVHVIRNSGSEVHVMVSKTFTVTGTEQGMPGGGAPPTTTSSTANQS
jgi:hypothetical protein